MDTLKYFVDRFELNLGYKSPINIAKINRLIMAQCLNDLGFRVGAEVGVAAGDHSLILLENISELTLFSIDPWHRTDGYNSYRDTKLREWEAQARAKLSPYPRSFILQQTSMEAVKGFADNSLDFVYLDGAHDFKNIAMDICEWIKKIRVGGILFGHDYTRIPTGQYACHVSEVVNAYALSHEINPWFTLGMPGKPDGLYRESQVSWMYIV